MNQNLFSDQDIKEIEARNLTLSEAAERLSILEKGSPFYRLNRPCTLGDGIILINRSDEERLIAVFDQAVEQSRVLKFVPASGAATRMFQSLLTAYKNLSSPTSASANAEPGSNQEEKNRLQTFARDLPQFPFYHELKTILEQRQENPEALCRQGHYRPILEALLFTPGLNLAYQPKALLPFHVYPDHVRTPFEEQLKESAAYTLDRQNRGCLHLTVSPEHLDLIRQSTRHYIEPYKRQGIHLEVNFSIQSPQSDTLAVDMEHRPLRDQQNRLIWHPGGHGALLNNLNALKGDIIFIKNIDNVAPDRLKTEAIRYKKILGGMLVTLQERVFGYLEKFKNGIIDITDLSQAFRFMHEWFYMEAPPAVIQGSQTAQVDFLTQCLNRPLRICGMVRNQGEPGGGPFWVEEPDGSASLQIVESYQVDQTSSEQQAIWQAATHFNPVDLVCGLRDYQDRPFDLERYVNAQKGFVSRKSRNGEEYQVYEWPGLWNGAMAHWNTVFVEVPLVTFTPVKTVFDLLRKEHQPE